MNVYIDSSPTRSGHSGRGIGQYTRMLIDAIKQYSDIQLVDTKAKAKVVHYPFFDLFFLTLPLIKNQPTIVTAHDVIPLLFPAAYPKGIRGAIKQFIQTISLSGAQQIVTDSNTSTTDVVRLLKQPPEKVKTVYLAADPRFSPASKEEIASTLHHFGLYQPYLLYVGDINYNKNLPELFSAVAGFETPIDLVMVSRTMIRSNPAATQLWKLVDKLGIGDRLRVLTDVPYEDLTMMRALYSAAQWYVQPSLYEGFGLPVLEAQACECPVISTAGGSLAEITNGSCLEFDLLKGGHVHADRAKYIALGLVNHQQFTWQKTAKAMERIYNQTAY